MADLNYTALMRWLESGDLNVPLHSGGVLDFVVYQFQVNVQRVVSLAVFPAIVVPDAMVSQLRRDAAAMSLYGQLAIDSPDNDHAERNAAIEGESSRRVATFESSILPPHPGLSEGMSGAKSIELFAGWDRHTADGMTALMGAVILGMWTAFETLAADLWVECLNARPRLGFIALDAEPSPEDDDATLDRKRNVKCPVPVWLFRDRSLDLNKSMGTILREQRRWDFGRRDRAADAYLKVFGRKDPRLAAVFDNDELQWLAATRNALVHKAGVADKEFTKLVARHPKLSRVRETQPIPLDGEITAEFADVALRKGTELIAFADDWLVKNEW